MPYSPLLSRLESDYQIQPLPIKAEGGGASTTPGTGLVAGGVISGLANIATNFINAQRTKNVYKFNAAMAQLQGRLIKLGTDVEIKNIREKAMSLFSTQQALYAKAGVAITGSPLEVMAESLKDAELDAIYTDINASLGIGAQETQAGIYKMAGKSAGYDALQNALGTVLGGITSYSKYKTLLKLTEG
jgi:hypothetical protein